MKLPVVSVNGIDDVRAGNSSRVDGSFYIQFVFCYKFYAAVVTSQRFGNKAVKS